MKAYCEKCKKEVRVFWEPIENEPYCWECGEGVQDKI